MATTNKSLTLPANNSDVNTWDVPVNGNFSILDSALGGLTVLNATGASGVVTLTASQYQPLLIDVTGTLTANVNYQLPSGVGGLWVINNGASGTFTVTFSSAGGGTSVTVPAGTRSVYICDGTTTAPASTLASAPGGSNTQIQYNASGVLTGSANFTFDGLNAGINGTFTIGTNLTVDGYVTINASGQGLTIKAGAFTTSVAVTFSATAMTVNCALSNVFSTVFTANVTTAPTLSNPSDGQTINWLITQDATGGRTMTWPVSFKWVGGSPGVLSTAANAVDLLVATYFVSTGNWLASLLKGFA